MIVDNQPAALQVRRHDRGAHAWFQVDGGAVAGEAARRYHQMTFVRTNDGRLAVALEVARIDDHLRVPVHLNRAAGRRPEVTVDELRRARAARRDADARVWLPGK